MGEQGVVGVGVVGLGFMGRTHLAAYGNAQRDGAACRVVAVSDRDPERLTGKAPAGGNLDAGGEAERLFDPADTSCYSDADELFADDAVDLVSICTHTDTHVEMATRALRAGKHVLVEKPVALEIESIEKLMVEQENAGRLCMPAMCMRFWPGWDWLKQVMQDRVYGAPVSARFERLGAAPGWGGGFYDDQSRSGGALFDLHVHDVDFVYFLFGKPARVFSSGTESHLSSSFEYDQVPGLVVAEGGWMTAPGFEFRMRFVVEFERAVADFDLGRDPVLVVYREGAPEVAELRDQTGYDGEVRHALDLARGKRVAPIAPLRDAVPVTGMILAERESLRTGKAIGLEERFEA